MPANNKTQVNEADQERTSQLMLEYQMNVALWQHDDNLRQQRNGIFLNMNSLLLVALGALITLKPTLQTAAFNAVLLALFGLPICIIWYFVQKRNAEYIKFRRYQLRSIEAQLGHLSTFTNQWTGLNQNKPVTFKGIDEKFQASTRVKSTTTVLEGNLPLITAIFWLLAFTLGAGSLVISLLIRLAA